MYILELIKVNKKEDLFFEDSDYYKNNIEVFTQFQKEFDDAHRDLFYKKEIKFTYAREKLIDGTFRNRKFVKYFKTKSDAKKYMADLFDNTQPINWTDDGVKYYTVPTTEWHKKTIDFHIDRQHWVMDNEIFNEMNILDVNGNFVECITSCSQNICIKYGGCKPGVSCEHQAPDAPQFKKDGISYHHIKVSAISKRVK